MGMPLRVRLPENSAMSPLELRSGIGPQADAVKDMSGLPTPMDRFPFVIFTGSRPVGPIAISSFFSVPQTLEGLISRIKYRSGFNGLYADPTRADYFVEYPVLDIKLGSRNITDNPLTLLPAPGAGVSIAQFNRHILDGTEGTIETNYPLPPNGLVQLIFITLGYATNLEAYVGGRELFAVSLEIEGTLWTRQA